MAILFLYIYINSLKKKNQKTFGVLTNFGYLSRKKK